jgi:hypothetical protein
MTSRMPAFEKPKTPVVYSPISVRPGLLQRCGGRQCPAGACEHEASRVPPVVHETLRSPGQPLPASTRAVMESQFGHDFSQVRVHSGDRAAEAAQAVSSDAFTVGNDVVFGARHWTPQTSAGSRLLAHELMHVVQQQAALGSTPGELEVGRPQDSAERQATAVATGFGHPWPLQAEPVPHVGLARQEAGEEDRPSAPILNPADPRMNKILERVAARGDENVQDPACQAPVAESPPWMPNVRQRSPIDLGKGTRREPKLKEPDGPTGAKCRGACGPDCPDTCKTVGSYNEQYEVGGCGYLIEFPNALLCGTHAGCRTHDACFDAAVANGETQLGGPRHVQCNWEANTRYGPLNTTAWARGLGPYDNWWYFVDDPVVRRSWRRKESAGPGSSPSP